MPNINITIPNPILLAGQHFKTRYRELPSGGWSGYTNRTNAVFTITGLSPANYQLEVILVKADETECAAVYQPFKVADDFSCISFTAEIIKQGSLYYLDVAWTLPGGYSAPACGWELVFQQGATTTKVPYATLPVSGNIKLLTTNNAGLFYMQANLCNGNTKQCSLSDVSAISDPPCTPLVQTGAFLSKVGSTYFITINFTQSSPATTSLYIKYNQFGVIIPGWGVVDPGGIITPTILPSATNVTFPVNINTHVADEKYHYNGLLVDGCGNGTSFTIDQWMF